MSARKRHKHGGEKRSHIPHPKQCSVCGKPVGNNEALIVKNTVYCCDAACRPDLTELYGRQQDTDAQNAPADRSVRRLIVHSSLTIALCAVVFAMWVYREMTGLRRENTLLRSSRSALIEQLKDNNRELRLLADTTLPQQQPLPPTEMPQKKPPDIQKPVRSIAPTTKTSHHFINGPVDSREVALTFDGGSLANVTGAILDTLGSRSVTATMFLTGNFIRSYPDMIRRIVSEGHECGNHTYNHPHLTTYAVDRTSTTHPDMHAVRLHEQLRRTAELFTRTTGSRFAPLWRAPYGEFNSELCHWAWKAGYLHVGWRQGRTWRLGLDSNDWVPDSTTPGFHTPQAFIDKVVHLSRLEPHGINGGIILMHLGTKRNNPAMQVHTVLGSLIDTLRTEGYTFVRVSELVRASGISLPVIDQATNIP